VFPNRTSPNRAFPDRWKRSGITFLLLFSSTSPIANSAPQIPSAIPPARTQVFASQNRNAGCKILYLGVVGGTETSGNPYSGVVQIRKILQGPAYSDVCVRSVTPYFWRSGLHWILGHFPSHPGKLTPEESAASPKVILVGHSLGGWGVLSVARNLNHKGIPVALSVQIDSVGITDRTVPPNVKAAVNFHADDALFLLTTKTTHAEDSTQTKLVQNVFVKNAGHWSVTRDPRIKDLVLCTVGSLRSGHEPTPDCTLPSQPDHAHTPPAEGSSPGLK